MSENRPEIVIARAASGIELFACGRPHAGTEDFASQARQAWGQLFRELAGAGVPPGEVAVERVFLSDIAAQIDAARQARAAAYAAAGVESPPAVSFVEQPPARPGQGIEVLAHAVRDAGGEAVVATRLGGLPAGVDGVVLRSLGTRRLVLCGLTGGDPGDGLAFEAQAARLFARAGTCLGREGLTFRQVVRTWLFLSDIGRDYAALNRARRAYFEAAGVRPAPASTGIAGRGNRADRLCHMDLVAFDGLATGTRRPLSVPVMNEAPSYGSDFSRGFEVRLADRRLIYISGTASIDAGGQVAHAGDVAAQARRMLENVTRLLDAAGAERAHLTHAVTYLKHAADLQALTDACAAAGLGADLPHVICTADVCRPEWLCEMEALAVVPAGEGR